MLFIYCSFKYLLYAKTSKNISPAQTTILNFLTSSLGCFIGISHNVQNRALGPSFPFSSPHVKMQHDNLLVSLILVNGTTTHSAESLDLCFSSLPQLILIYVQSISLSYWVSLHIFPIYQLLTIFIYTSSQSKQYDFLPSIASQFPSLPCLPSAVLKSNQNDVLKIECRYVIPLLKIYHRFSIYLK